MMDIERYRYHHVPEAFKIHPFDGLGLQAEMRGKWEDQFGTELRPIRYMAVDGAYAETLAQTLMKAINSHGDVWIEGERVEGLDRMVSGRNTMKIVWVGTDADLLAYEKEAARLK